MLRNVFPAETDEPPGRIEIGGAFYLFFRLRELLFP